MEGKPLPVVEAVAKEILAYVGHLLLLPVGTGRDPEREVAAGERTVLLVHGYMAKASVLRPLRYYLERRGHSRVATFAHGGTDVERIAHDLAAWLDDRVPEGPIDVVAHSLGGLAVRLWIQDLGGARRVDRCVLLGVPHRGTERARLPLTGLAELRPDSPVLDRLARGVSRAQDVRYTSVLAQGDLFIRPVESAAFELGEVHRLSGLGHNGLLFSPRVFRIVAGALAS